MRVVPSARLDGADVARDLSRKRGRGRIDQGARRRAADAAVAHRQERRHPGVQERSLAERRSRSTRSSRWVDAGAPQGDPKDMPPPIEWPDASVWNFAEAVRRTARSHRQVAAVHDAGARAGRLGQARHAVPASPNRAGSARSRSGPPPSKAARSSHHALARLQQDDADRHRAPQPTTTTTAASTPAPGLFMEWAVGKQGEIMRPDTGKLLLPGSQIRWDIHYSHGRRRDHQRRRARHLLLPERPGAEVPPGAASDGRHHAAASTFRRTRQGHAGLLRDEAERAASRASSRTCTCAARR